MVAQRWQGAGLRCRLKRLRAPMRQGCAVNAGFVARLIEWRADLYAVRAIDSTLLTVPFMLPMPTFLPARLLVTASSACLKRMPERRS